MTFHTNQLFNDGSSAVTADGQSSGLTVGPGEYDIDIVVQAKSGTSPTMDIKVQESDDGSTWYDLAVFPQMTAVGQWNRKVKTERERLRLDYNVGGTSPSFTLVAGLTRGANP